MKKNELGGVLKLTFKSLIQLVKGTIYAIYLIIYNIDNFGAWVYKKLPRIIKVIIIYFLIGGTILYFVKPRTKEIVITTKEIEIKEVAVEVEPKKEVEEVEEVKKCELGEVACKIYNKGIEVGMSENEALLVVAISRHETGNWTSAAFKNNNNFGGVMCSSGLKNYSSFDEGLEDFVNLLNDYYFGQGLDTIEKIGAKYCPVGASNDPNGLNVNWVPRVTEYYNEYTK